MTENNDKNLDLERIIEGCKKGNSESFERLIDIFSRRCYGYFYRLSGDRTVSNDLLSQLFLKLVTKIGTYRTGSFQSWLFKIAKNIFYDHLREKQHQQKILERRKNELEIRTTEEKSFDNEKLDKLQFQLNKLDSDIRELITLRFYSQLSFKEIAKMRSEPIGTTLAKMHRALKKLRELME